MPFQGWASLNKTSINQSKGKWVLWGEAILPFSIFPPFWIGSMIKEVAIFREKNLLDYWTRKLRRSTVFIRVKDESFILPKLLQIYNSVWSNSAMRWISPFKNNPKNLDPSYKMDLDFRDCFGRGNTLVL